MGLPTPATIGNRMGNTFGTSAYSGPRPEARAGGAQPWREMK